ncbi:MAG: ABC transporter ATP-binding protein [Acidobacteriota bacterium]
MNVAVEPVLAVETLSVRYGRRNAVDGVSLSVPRGTVYALLGRNGAGKSSLVRCVLGHRKPEHGVVRLFGDDVWRRRSRLMTRVGVVPEEPDAPPAMTSRQLLAFSSPLYPGWKNGDAADRMGRFGVPLDVPFGRLSKGQKGQVMLALALGSAPELLVLDDPTLGLDVVARRELYEELVGELADRGTTVFVTTHDIAGIEGIADRVGILREGRLVLDLGIEELKARFRRIRMEGEHEVPQSLEPVSVTRRPWGTEAVVARFDEAALAGLPGAEASPLSLEEIFVAVAGNPEVPR